MEVKNIFRLILLVALLLSVGCFAQNAPFGKVREIKTGKVLGLENGLMSISFDAKTGKLVSLKNLVTKDEYLKDAKGDGNPFRAYVDCTELPSALTHPWPALNPPVEGAMGGKLVDSRDCMLMGTNVEQTTEGMVLHLDIQSNNPKLLFKMDIKMANNDPLCSMQLTVANNGDTKRKIMMGVPYLTGLSLGKNRETNLGVRLREFGQSRAPAWQLNGDIYGRGWSGQWNAAYEPTLGEGIGMIVKDKDVTDKIIRRFKGGGMSVFYFDNDELDVNKEKTYPTTEILVNKGDWKPTASRYGDWFKTSFQLRKVPKWLDNVGMFIGSWMPHPDAVAAAKKKSDSTKSKINTGCLTAQQVNSLVPAVIQSFRDVQRLYLGNQYDIQEWAYYWQSILKTDCYNAYDHTDGQYLIRQDLGGVPAIRDGIIRLERIGRVMGLYVASKSLRLDSDFLLGDDPNKWLYMGTPDEKIPSDALSIHVCSRYDKWQDYLAQVCKRLLWETGAKYIRLDEAGGLFDVCYNPAHHHKSPYYNVIKDNIVLLQKVRAAMDEVDPEALLFTEGGCDLLNLYCTGALNLWYNGTDISPLHLSVPNYIGFSYGTGQIECALNGIICGGTNPISTGGDWSEHHNRIWGPGLEHFPECYKQEGKPAETRWHELGYTFVDAARRGNPTDINPTTPAYQGAEKENWAGRLWRSDKYWLLTCGNLAAIRPQKEVLVQLPELPPEITKGYEFDFETLAMREVPVLREKGDISVKTINGFSAVLLPKGNCPALVDIAGLSDIKKGSKLKIKLSSYAPWRTTNEAVTVWYRFPGLMSVSRRLTLPGEVELTVPEETEPGNYYIKVDGNCLGLKRWFKVIQ